MTLAMRTGRSAANVRTFAGKRLKVEMVSQPDAEPSADARTLSMAGPTS